MVVYIIGLIAQFFFGARTLLQWFLSERAKKVVSPTIYWIFSILASYMFCIYGWLREDFAIIIGQMIAYYIYIWNLNAKGWWKRIHFVFRLILILTPFFAIAFALKNADQFLETFLRNDNIPLWLVIFGVSGQIIFTFRFVYQFFYSVKRDESILPLGFWLISFCGSMIIISYAIIRRDPILIMGQISGFMAYTRNIMLYFKNKK